MDTRHTLIERLMPLRPFLALFVFLLIITPLMWGIALTYSIDIEQALSFFLPGFFVCFGYYVASNAPMKK